MTAERSPNADALEQALRKVRDIDKRLSAAKPEERATLIDELQEAVVPINICQRTNPQDAEALRAYKEAREVQRRHKA